MAEQIIVVGGGAAGFFTAINIKQHHPLAQILILEKSNKLLSKVIVSGGGRCNVTNGREKAGELTPFYPRGGKKLYKIFEQFGPADMRDWLQKNGVKTKTEPDLRVFPISDRSQDIADCFLSEAKRLGIKIHTQEGVKSISYEQKIWTVLTAERTYSANSIIWTTGSSEASWNILRNIGLKINEGVPSLFTFNIEDQRIASLPGVSFPDTVVKIGGTKLIERGPLLITHWGISGPAILKLSAWGARELAAKNYRFTIIINFLNESTHEQVQDLFKNPDVPINTKLKNYKWTLIPKRYWENLLIINGLENKSFADLSKKEINKLAEELTQAHFKVTGKSTFKDEFVTCGGVDLSEMDLEKFECKRFPGLYLAGEVLDIDALTGGFNFQACWSAGWIIGQNFKK